MRNIIIAKIILLTALIPSPVSGHVLMPMTYQERQAQARLIVIAEPATSSDRLSDDAIEFKVLVTLKGKKTPSLKVARSTVIDEERLNCCISPGQYILFLKRGRDGLYESVHGDYGVVRLLDRSSGGK
jgi:hypothetical protein